jgi:DNA-binding CsgD family transcriptional regulator
LVGRDAELEVARGALDAALAGDGRVLLVSGEPGIGKTRFVEELGALADSQGALVAWGRVDDIDGSPPYWPWLQLLEVVFATADPGVLADALAEHAGSISAIVPGVAAFVEQVTPAPRLAASATRFRLHTAIVEVVRRVAASGPLVLVLEDMHWADVSSLELARFAAARLMAVPVLLVVTYRSVDGGDGELLDDVLASLARQPSLQRVALTGLSASEVGLFMAQTTGLRPRRAESVEVQARTEGNPFFVGEIARLRHSEGDEDAEAVPAGVRDVIRRRLARLPEHTRELLVLGAVLGREFELALLARSAGVENVAAAEGLEAALVAGLLVDAADGRSARFSHALVRETLYGDLSALRRATLHARIGEVLERDDVATGAAVSELAWHFARAAGVLGPERGLRYVLQAAEAAEAAVSYERAEEELRRALALVELLPEGVERWERELEVQNRLVVLIFFTHGFAAAAAGEAGARARELCERVGDSASLFQTLNNLAAFHYVRGELGVQLEIGEQLLSVGRERSNARWLTAGHMLVGLAQLHVGELTGARANFELARELAARLELTPDVAQAFFGVHPTVFVQLYSSRLHWCLGEASQARAFADAGTAIATRLGHPHTLAFAWYLDGHLRILMGDVEGVLALSEHAIEFCTEHGLATYASWFRVFAGWAICELGRPDEGVAIMAPEIAANHASGAGTNKPVFLALFAQGELRRGDPARALALVEQGLTEMRETRMWESDLRRRRGELLATMGAEHRAQALEELHSAVRVADAQGSLALRRLAQASLQRLGGAAPGVPGAGQAGDVNLSPRERELLGLLGRGMTDKQIAAELVISLATVRSHLDRIRDKTGRRRRPDLTRLAVELGLAVG